MTPLIISRLVAHLMTIRDWTKQSMHEFLWRHSRIPMKHLRRSGARQWSDVDTGPVQLASLDFDPWPITAKSENLILVCTGGDHPTNSCRLQGYSPNVIGRKILLPNTFDRLIANADRDLGCGADACMI